MLDRYIQQLSSQDVETRRLAIIALGNSADQRAMGALANVYKNDPDPALRELALKAGRHIKRTTTGSLPVVRPDQVVPPEPAVTTSAPPQTQLPKVSPFDTSKPFTADPAVLVGTSTLPATAEPVAAVPTVSQSTAVVPAEPVAVTPLPKITPLPVIAPTKTQAPPPTEVAPRRITEREKQLAKGKLDSAIGMMTHGEIELARNELVAAVQINPELAKDTLAMNLATRVTGMNSPDEAIQTIVHRAQIAAADRTKEGPKHIKFVLDSDIKQMLIMIGALVLVMAVVGIAYKYARISLIEMTESVRKTRTTAEAFAAAQARQVTIGDTLKYGALFTFDTLFDTVTLYTVGTWLGGSGLVLQFIRSLLRVQVVMYVAVAVGMVIMALGFHNASASAYQSSLGLIYLGAAITGLSFVIGFIWKIIAVGRQHEVDFVMAFMITLAGTVLSYLAIGIIPIA